MMKHSLYFLSLASMKNRLLSSCLTILSISLSIALLIGVDRIRTGAKESFEHTISDTDLIVGARSGPIQLMLYSVFHIGNATQNISWESYQKWKNHSEVKWSVPLSLGDSHKGYRVVGTSESFFQNYKYARKKQVEFERGKAFSDIFHVVLGSDVAKTLKYDLKQEITLAHGISEFSFQDHADKPFEIVGILKKTGTPLDRSLFIQLEGMSAIHVDWQDGAPPLGSDVMTKEQVRRLDLTPTDITSMLIGLKSKMGIFRVQREINDFEEEAMLAVLPGVALQELWEVVGVAESALFLVASFVVLSSLLGLVSSMLTTLSERRREIAILRSLGASPWDIFILLISEAAVIGLSACFFGSLMIFALQVIGQPIIESYYGLHLQIKMFGEFDIILLLSVLGLSVLSGLIPALRAYRQTLSDGLTVKI